MTYTVQSKIQLLCTVSKYMYACTYVFTYVCIYVRMYEDILLHECGTDRSSLSGSSSSGMTSTSSSSSSSFSSKLCPKVSFFTDGENAFLFDLLDPVAVYIHIYIQIYKSYIHTYISMQMLYSFPNKKMYLILSVNSNKLFIFNLRAYYLETPKESRY